MFQFTRKDQKSGITYVYEQESHWVPELRQSRATRRVIGKLDEEGNMVPTRPRKKKDSAVPSSQTSGENRITDDRIENLEKRITVLEKQIVELQKIHENDMQIIRKIGSQLISME